MAATACRVAVPLGLAPLPRGGAGGCAFLQCGSKVSRGVVAVRATSSGEGSVETPEFVKAVQDAWEKVEDKYAVATLGVAGIVALWTAVGAIRVELGLVKPCTIRVLEKSIRFIFGTREALFSKIESTYKEITGSSKCRAEKRRDKPAKPPSIIWPSQGLTAAGYRGRNMILVAIMAELLEEYTAAVARAVERLLSAAPRGILPRRVRFLVLRNLPLRDAVVVH
ncbi:hypothetical protein PR202_gb20726 [Eleusine coracana subsp. coracana]|uniref:Uncharacterized protein n=1 Tax=Eleusine coracana subsp. coracana TaxID=191504 RepID=A0AAV5FD99_ELECO|nr:hypothetical protein PR202_gb20726 [Eleusine coracana subsp. coracana]